MIKLGSMGLLLTMTQESVNAIRTHSHAHIDQQLESLTEEVQQLLQETQDEDEIQSLID